jgi:predicted aconitase
MGYLLDENRRGTHRFAVKVPEERLRSYDAWCALGYHIGEIVGSEVPVVEGVGRAEHEWLIGFGAALATAGSVTLFHVVGVTPEAPTVGAAFQGDVPGEVHEVTEADLDAVNERFNTVPPGAPVDFVTLGCPHYSLAQLEWVAEQLRGKHVAEGVRFWVNTNRITRREAEESGALHDIEEAGALVVADTCAVESHMRQSTCREHGLPVPNVQALVTDSVKMARYVGDLIGCRTAFVGREACIEAALSGRRP